MVQCSFNNQEIVGANLAAHININLVHGGTQKKLRVHPPNSRQVLRIIYVD